MSLKPRYGGVFLCSHVTVHTLETTLTYPNSGGTVGGTYPCGQRHSLSAATRSDIR